MRDKIIIGSTAMRHHFPEFKREPKDLDYAVLDSKEYKSTPEVEYLTNPILFKYTQDEFIPADLLFTLKVSHLFWDINWDKHMFDVQYMLKKGCQLNMNFLDEMIDYWMEHNPKIRRSNLDSSKEEFFTNAVNDGVDQHDYLHTILNPIPMYTLLLKDGSEVELDESKFHVLTLEQKKAVVFEETAVMAFERYVKTHYKVAFMRQLKDNIIKHFPRYIALFAIEHYIDMHLPKINYREIINNGLQKAKQTTVESVELA